MTAKAAVPYREATADELAGWDDLTVRPAGGHVLQSRAWAEHRATRGWQPRYLVGDDGSGVLALIRPWPLVGGASAYIPRGPAPTGDLDAAVARLDGATRWLARQGIDVVASDAEVQADGYARAISRLGYKPIEEIQPSRHRVSLDLRDRSEDDVLSGVAKSTRQRIRKAQDDAITVVRHDGRMPPSGPGDEFATPAEPPELALDRFYDLLLETGERKQFAFGPRDSFLAWWRAALRAGHLVLLEARTGDGPGAVQAGLLLYRHGDRLSTVHSGDHASARRDHPGALHLLRWRAIQLAIREGRSEMDLGGADVAGARREPREGEPMWGLYQHKRSFGAEWLELTGAHERVIDAGRYRAGRIAARVARVLGR